MVTDQHRQEIAEAIASIDQEMIRYLKTLTVAERVQIGFAMTEVATQDAVAALRRNHPWLSERDAYRMFRNSGRASFLWERHQP